MRFRFRFRSLVGVVCVPLMQLACSAGHDAPAPKGTTVTAAPTNRSTRRLEASNELRALGATHLSFDGDNKGGQLAVYAESKLLARVRFEQDDTHTTIHVKYQGHYYDVEMTVKGVDMTVDQTKHAHATFDEKTRTVVQDEASKALFASATEAFTLGARGMAQVVELKGPIALAAPKEVGNGKLAGGPSPEGAKFAEPGADHVESGGTCTKNGIGGKIVDGASMSSTYYTPWTKTIGCSAAIQNLNNSCSNEYCWGCNTIAGCDCSCVIGDTLCAFCTAFGNACDCNVPTQYCGDGFCQYGVENCGNCAADCGCTGNTTCNGSVCVPNCDMQGKTCGYDTCYVYHGCPSGMTCNAYGNCEGSCTLIGECGTDSCGVAHDCPSGEYCSGGSCYSGGGGGGSCGYGSCGSDGDCCDGYCDWYTDSCGS